MSAALPADQASLLRDARLLLGHAVRHGELPPDSRIVELLAGVTDGAPMNAATLGDLYREVDLLARAVAPVTLAQLTRRGTWVGRARRFTAAAAPFALGFVTLILTMYLAFQSSQLSQADTALREYQDYESQLPKQKLFNAWKMYHYERVLKVERAPFAQLDAYQVLVESARELAEKGKAIQAMLFIAQIDLYLPETFEEHGPLWLQNLAKQINNRQPPADPSDLPESKFADPCATQPPSNVPIKGRTATPPDLDVTSYRTQYECFLGSIDVDPLTLSVSPWDAIYKTRSKVALLTVWFLPGLYGLLGSCVYLMRRIVLVDPATVTRDTRILNVLSLTLRVALGGLAGIIIGWFWVPTTTGGATAPPISSLPFGLAFFAGFSIETLFSVLDRIKASISGGGAAAGTQTTPPKAT